jgi:hypothetical protein
MSRKTWLKLAPLSLLLLVPLAGTRSAAPAGAPWISVEMPANPMDGEVRDAAMLVHAYYHEKPVNFGLTGTAEGLVDGERRTVELEFERTSRAGVYALTQQWPSEGHWVLNVTAEGGSAVSLVLELGPDGGVRAERYYDLPSKTVSARSVRVVQGKVSKDRIESVLSALAVRSED